LISPVQLHIRRLNINQTLLFCAGNLKKKQDYISSETKLNASFPKANGESQHVHLYHQPNQIPRLPIIMHPKQRTRARQVQ
jgi:hypothetical protein